VRIQSSSRWILHRYFTQCKGLFWLFKFSR